MVLGMDLRAFERGLELLGLARQIDLEQWVVLDLVAHDVDRERRQDLPARRMARPEKRLEPFDASATLFQPQGKQVGRIAWSTGQRVTQSRLESPAEEFTAIVKRSFKQTAVGEGMFGQDPAEEAMDRANRRSVKRIQGTAQVLAGRLVDQPAPFPLTC